MMQKTVIKYMPYSALEFDKIESWLEEMALRGLELTDISGRFAKFKRTEPRKIRYRIGWSDCGRRTKWEEEYLDGCKELGWDFVAIFSNAYYVFRTEDENAVEFFTDKTLFERSIKRKVRRKIIWSFILLALVTLNYLWALNLYTSASSDLFIFLVENGFSIFPYGAVVVFLCTVFLIGRIISLLKLHHRLRSGEALDHRKRPYRSRPIMTVVSILLLMLYIPWLGYVWYANYSGRYVKLHPLQTYEYSYLYPLLDEINEEEWQNIEAYSPLHPSDYGADFDASNFVMLSHTELAPVIVMTRQYGSEKESELENGWFLYETTQSYSVDYYELRSPRLAEKYFDEKAAIFGDGGAEEIASGGLDAVRYDVSADGFEQDLLILKDHAVISVRYMGDSNILEYLDLYAAYLA